MGDQAPLPPAWAAPPSADRSDEEDGSVSTAARLIWTAGGFLPPAEPPGSVQRLSSPPGAKVSNGDRPRTVAPKGSPIASRSSLHAASRTALPALSPRTPMALSGLGSRKESAEMLRSSYSSVNGGSDLYVSRTSRGSQSARGSGSQWLSDDARERRVLERRNRRLQVELQQALTLYGQTVDWQQKQRGELAEQHEREAGLWRQAQEEQMQERLAWQADIEKVKCECQKEIESAAQQVVKVREEMAQEISRLKAVEVAAANSLKARLAQEREARIEATAQRSARRLISRSISLAWAAWAELQEERQWQRRMMVSVSNRVRKPTLTAAYRQWHTDWERAEALRHAAEKERLRVAQREQQEAFTAQMAALQAESASQLSAAEEAKRRALDLQRVELMGTSEQQLAARAERDREERVQLLRRQIARRILHQDLVRGWSTWHEQWELQSYQQRVLRQVAMRLSKPAVSGAYRFWCEEWQAAERKSMREAAESVTTRLKTCEAELISLRTLYEAAEEERKELAERLGIHGEEEVESKRLYEAQLQEEKDARVELLKRQIARRILRQDLVRSWSSWMEYWEISCAHKQALRQAANLLHKPALSSCFRFWHTDWRETEQFAERERLISKARREKQDLEKDRDRLAAEVEQLRLEMERKVNSAEIQMRLALERQHKELTGTSEERLQLKEAKDREERVALLHRQIARRMQHQDLLRGWVAWHEVWETRTAERRTLKRMADTLVRPGLAASFRFWLTDWLSTVHELEVQGVLRAGREREEELSKERDSLARELAKLREESAAQLEMAQNRAKVELDRQVTKIIGTYEERERVKEETEKEARVELLRRQITRRIMYQEIVRGFNTWHQHWWLQTSQQRILRRVESRLRRPALSWAYRHWYDDWQVAELLKERGLRKSLEKEVYSLRYQMGALDLEKVAWADERAALNERLRIVLEESLPEATQAKQEAGRKLFEVQQSHAAMAEQLEHAQWHGPGVAAAEKARDEALVAMKEQQAGYQAELQRLLAEQRKNFESELPARLNQEARELAEKLRLAEQRAAEMLRNVQEEWEQKLAESAAEHEKQRDEQKTELVRLMDIVKTKEAAAKFADLARDASGGSPSGASRDAATPSGGSRKAGAKGSGSGKGVLSGFVIDPDSNLSVSQQIGEALADNGARVMDLFREWDTNGDGSVDKKEFRENMVKLGLEVDKKEIDALFDSWDKDGGGSLDYKELGKLLRPSPTKKKR